jgi:hypothetical protein
MGASRNVAIRSSILPLVHFYDVCVGHTFLPTREPGRGVPPTWGFLHIPAKTAYIEIFQRRAAAPKVKQHGVGNAYIPQKQAPLKILQSLI